MASFTIKRNDRLPPLRADLLYSDGTAIDLTGASVSFFLVSLPTGSVFVSGVASVIGSAADGVVRYSWGSGTTGTKGSYRAEFSVNYGGGITLTAPNSGYITVDIVEDLG